MSSEKNTESVKKTEAGDDDLSELLDSALKDFTKDDEKEVKKTEETQEIETAWSEEFIRQAAEQFESNVAHFLKETRGANITSEQVQQSFQQMAAAATAITNSSEGVPDTEFTASITQALKDLTVGAENLQNPFSENDLMSMVGQMDGEQNVFIPFMQGMMQSLLSKDVLYPSLKEILNKYPGWLEAKGGSLSSNDRQRFEKQQELMKDVCSELEQENESDSAEDKKERFEKVLMLMQKLQDYGQPPSELVGDLGPTIPFDAEGNPNLNQCCLM